ncbi:DUF4188 domain-containing protein [Flexivirga meconopsidis]|uniref:DUF4188 domain-containing protein n=1 Tax=Flexivirga meconopsidis TaxID=2977121 RepID=UPI0022400EC2|nr:DUF4188 domain-containing protein [Flexivirga meconopsidis]
MKFTMTTHAHEGELAVFLIGMTVRKPWRVDQWARVGAAMAKMQLELQRNKAAADRGEAQWLGFLGGYNCVGPRGPVVVQYWRNAEDIYRYANDARRVHRPAWLELYRKAHGQKHDGGIGLWHETYAVPAGGHESAYGNLPDWGLAKATGSIPLSRRGRTARERMGAA